MSIASASTWSWRSRSLSFELECLARPPSGISSLPLTSVAAALVVAPVAVRRRWPAAALVFASSALTIQALLGGDLDATERCQRDACLGSACLRRRRVARSAPRPRDAIVARRRHVQWLRLPLRTERLGGIGSELFALAVVFVAPWFVGRLARERSRRAASFS